ncbi:hypothetical protein [Mycobacterium sp. SA01]|uniref:hypothetical protein n=1 Tax=Mycobacterium sp. SA01 TaxID=3238820 RepID=UPI00351BC796
MSNGRSAGGGGVGGFILILVALWFWIEHNEAAKAMLIAFGVVVAIFVIGLIAYWVNEGAKRHDEMEQKRALIVAQCEREDREERARLEKQRRIDTLGKENAALLESALTAVELVRASEAAIAGWLPDVEFGPNIQWITANFEKAHRLRKVADELSGLDNPGADDRKTLAEARNTIANLERAAVESVELIGKCATEAQLIDESLRNERRDAKVAEKRAELTAMLSAELYGIEAAPDTAPNTSAMDAVMARAEAYREIKNHLRRAPR